MTLVYIALGSNLGDRLGNLRAAIAQLADAGIAVTDRSSIWETAPVPEDQPAFLNAAIAAETDLDPAALLAALKAIEHALGRRPERHWGPRPIDLDILFYGSDRVETATLTIPHALIAERSFVLAPLADIIAGPLPVLGVSVLELLARTGRDGLRRTALELDTGRV